MWLDTNDIDIPKDYQKLKQQNIKLRNELKQINEYLTKQIEKKQDHQHNQKTLNFNNQDFREDTLKAELMNAQKQIKIQLKQIQILQNRQEMVSLDNIVQLQSQLKKLSDRIKELELEKKTLTLINGKQEKKLVELTQDEIIKHRIEQLESENQQLKQRILNQARSERSQSVQVTKVEPMLKPIQLTQKQQEILKEKDNFILQLQEKIVEQDKHIKILNNLKGQYDKQISAMAHKIKTLETQLLLTHQQLSEKNFELNRKNHLLPNLSARNQKGLQPKINLNLSVDNSLLEVHKTQFNKKNASILNNISTQSQQSQQSQRSDEKLNIIDKQIEILKVKNVGNVNEEFQFKDQEGYYRLQNIKLWWNNDYLAGIQGYYQNSQKYFSGKVFCQLQQENLTQQVVELNQQDYIKQIDIGFQGDLINFIKIISQNNCVLKFGSENQNTQTILADKDEILSSLEGSFKENLIISLGIKIFHQRHFN